MMTIHKLTAGDGYQYLLRQVATGDNQAQRGQDASAYYTATGNPPGRWAGAGAALLGLAGEVTERQMKALYDDGMHPDAEQIIARYLDEHITADMTDVQARAGPARELPRAFRAGNARGSSTRQELATAADHGRRSPAVHRTGCLPGRSPRQLGYRSAWPVLPSLTAASLASRGPAPRASRHYRSGAGRCTG
jgi:hypothetical protein